MSEPIQMKKLKNVLISCLREGGRVIKRGFGKTLKISKKAPISLVTNVDIEADRTIISIIRRSFPEHRILTEESVPYHTPSPYRWIIDPLDGTTNFAHKLPLCCVSIAVEFKGTVILSGIFNPILNELFFAELGRGAFLNGKKIRVSKQSRMLDSLLVTGFPYDRRKKAEFYTSFLQVIMEKCLGVRRLGSAALDLAYVACGRFEAFWELNLNPWDIAAGVLIVQEAGGKTTDFQGKALNIDRPYQLLSSNKRVHASILSLFKKINSSP